MLSHFYNFLLVKTICEASLDSGGEEIDSNSGWENVQSCISRGTDSGREIIVDLQTTYLRRHGSLLFPKKDRNHPSFWHKHSKSSMHTCQISFAISLFMRVCVGEFMICVYGCMCMCVHVHVHR